MKKILFLFVVCALLTASVDAQVSLGRKVQKSDFGIGMDRNVAPTLKSINEIRLAYGFNATALNLKTGEISAVSSTGIGVAVVTHKLNDAGEVYKSWQYGGMLLLGTDDQSPLIDEVPKSYSVGVMAFGGIGPVSIGPSYFFAEKTWLLNLNIGLSF